MLKVTEPVMDGSVFRMLPITKSERHPPRREAEQRLVWSAAVTQMQETGWTGYKGSLDSFPTQHI